MGIDFYIFKCLVYCGYSWGPCKCTVAAKRCAMQKEDIEFYIGLAVLIIFGIAIGIYVWHVQMAALSTCTKPCTILNSFLEAHAL